MFVYMLLFFLQYFSATILRHINTRHSFNQLNLARPRQTDRTENKIEIEKRPTLSFSFSLTQVEFLVRKSDPKLPHDVENRGKKIIIARERCSHVKHMFNSYLLMHLIFIFLAGGVIIYT